MYLHKKNNYNAKLFVSLVLVLLGIMALMLSQIYSAPSYLISSIVILILFAFSIYLYGLVSVPVIVFSAAYLPALAFLWAAINGAQYINYHNFWLQNNIYYVDYSVFLASISMLFSFAFLLLVSISMLKRVNAYRSGLNLGHFIYFICTISSAFFFWLTEPSFNTIISSSYDVVLEERIENTQYAGAVAIIFWLFALLSYLNRKQLGYCKYRILDRLFIAVTVFSVLWLALHARRSELIGIGLVWILILADNNGKRKAALVAGLLAIILFVIGEVRSISLILFFSNEGSINQVSNIAKLPGGMSNIFMTFLNTIHYYDSHPYIYGETFINYILQILPTSIYNTFGVQIPDYFYQMYYNYSYNGGNYLGSMFYGNFGLFGIIILGLYVSAYVIFVVKLINSTVPVSRVVGLFLLAFLFRGFWYELITIIKPILLVFLPIYILYKIKFFNQKAIIRNLNSTE